MFTGFAPASQGPAGTECEIGFCEIGGGKEMPASAARRPHGRDSSASGVSSCTFGQDRHTDSVHATLFKGLSGLVCTGAPAAKNSPAEERLALSNDAF